MNQLLNAAVALLLLTLILYAAVWLLEQIWIWLVIIGAVALLLVGIFWLVRWRRGRW